MYGKLFLYTPRSGSKIFAKSQSPVAPRWAVETLTNGSHIIHYTAPLYRVPPSTRQHRADVGAILRHVARQNPARSLLAWDDRGQISFICDEKGVMDIEQIFCKFGRGEGLIQAIAHQREEEAIFGSGGADTRLFAHPITDKILHVTNNYVSTHPAHKSRATLEAERATFGDLPISDAQYITSEVLDTLWNGMSAPVPTEEEAEQIAERFAAWMNWLSTEPHAAEMKAMLLTPIGPELQDWANEFFSKHHHISLDFHPAYPAHWSIVEDEIASEPIAEIAEPTPAEIAAQKKNEADAAFAEVWREHFRGQIGHWMASSLDYPYPCVDSDADVAVAHAAICRRLASMWAGYSHMNGHTPDLFYRATDPSSAEMYPASLPPVPVSEYGDSPNKDVWVEWFAALDASELLDFIKWMEIFYSQTSEMWEEIDIAIASLSQKQWDVMSQISHTFPFPCSGAVVGLDGHPTRHELAVLPPRKTQDLNNNRRRLPPHKWNVIRRHFAALVKMAEHAPAE